MDVLESGFFSVNERCKVLSVDANTNVWRVKMRVGEVLVLGV